MALTGLSPEEIVKLEWEHRHTLFPEQQDDELVMGFDPLTYGFFTRTEEIQEGEVLLARFEFRDGRWSDRHIVKQTTAETWLDVPSGKTWAWRTDKVAVIGVLSRVRNVDTDDIVAGIRTES